MTGLAVAAGLEADGCGGFFEADGFGDLLVALDFDGIGIDDMDEDDGFAASVVVVDSDGVGATDEVADDALVPVSDEPQADRPRASAGTIARSVILRVMGASGSGGRDDDHGKQFGTEPHPAW